MSLIKKSILSGLVILFSLSSFSEEETTTTINTKPWLELESQVMDLQSRVRIKEDEIKKLIDAKNYLPDGSKQLSEMGQTIQREHKALGELISEYEKARNQLRFRYPERMADESKFNKLQFQSVSEMEESMGIQSKMDRNLKRARQQYRDSAPSSPLSGEAHQRFSPTTTTLLQQPIDQQRPIILRK